MKFKIDENLPDEAAGILRDAGYDADTVADERLSGASDETIAIRVREDERVLLTLDLDFANIQAYDPREHAGTVVLRMKRQDKRTVLSHVRRFVAVLVWRSPLGELCIVEKDRVRFRRPE